MSVIELTQTGLARKPGMRYLTQPLALPFNPWWLMWVVAIAGAWLLPTHFIPWGAFHADLLMALALLPASFWIVLRAARPLQLNVSVIVSLLTVCVPFLQLAGGMIYFAGDAWIASAYLYGFALALLVGARFEQVVPGQLIGALFGAIGVAALLSTGILLYQWLGLSGLGLLTPQFLKGYRPFANLGQSNNTATLLVWGLLTLWWTYLAGRVRGWVAGPAAAFLMLGIVATQSRTGWVEVALLGVAALLYRRPLATLRYASGLVALAAVFVVLVLSWAGLNQALHLDVARTLSEEMSPGLRPAAWKLFLDALTQRPWTGWGWNQQSVAQIAVALEHANMRYTFQSAHNLIIDLLVQNGMVLGALLTLALVIWLAVKALQANTSQSCLLLLAVCVLLVHSLLEFPQNYAYFLLPAGLMMGALDAMHPARRVVQMRRWVAVTLLSLGTGLTAWITVEYNLAERSLERVRFERARVGPSRNSKAPDLVMLTQLRELLRFLRLHPAEGMTALQLDTMSKVVERFPSDANQLIYAISAGLNGQPEIAHDALARMCLMVQKERCLAALAAWRSMAASSPVLASIEVPTPQ